MSLYRGAVSIAILGGLWALGSLLLLDRYLVYQEIPAFWRLTAVTVMASGFVLLAGTAAICLRVLQKVSSSLADLIREKAGKSRQELAEVSSSLAASLASVGNLVEVEAKESRRQLEGAVSLYATLRPSAPFAPLQDWAISGDSGAHIVRLIRTTRPQNIVELGSGVSTLLIGLAVKRFKLQTQVRSIEHDETFAKRTRDALHREGLIGRVSVIHAPLSNVCLDGRAYLWYQPSCLADLSDIDLLLVDGPPTQTGLNARYPALPMLLPKLSPRAIILLDDANRTDETNILRKWCEEAPDFKWSIWRSGGKGLAIGERCANKTPAKQLGPLQTAGPLAVSTRLAGA